MKKIFFILNFIFSLTAVFGQIKISYFYEDNLSRSEIFLNKNIEYVLENVENIKIVSKSLDISNIDFSNFDISVDYLVRFSDIYFSIQNNLVFLGGNLLFINPQTAVVEHLLPTNGSGFNQDKAIENILANLYNKISNYNFNTKKKDGKNLFYVTVKHPNKINFSNRIPNTLWYSALSEKIFEMPNLVLVDNKITPLVIEELKKNYLGLSEKEKEIGIKNIDYIFELEDITASIDRDFRDDEYKFSHTAYMKLSILSVKEEGRIHKFPIGISEKSYDENISNSYFLSNFKFQIKRAITQKMPTEEMLNRSWLNSSHLKLSENLETIFTRKQIAIYSVKDLAVYNRLIFSVSEDNRFELLDKAKSLDVINEWKKRFSGITENSNFVGEDILKDVWFIIETDEPVLVSEVFEDSSGEKYYLYHYVINLMITYTKENMHKDTVKIVSDKNRDPAYVLESLYRSVENKLKDIFKIKEKFYPLGEFKNREIIYRGDEIGIKENMQFVIYDLDKKVGAFDVVDSTKDFSLVYPIYLNKYKLADIRGKDNNLFMIEKRLHNIDFDLNYLLYFNPTQNGVPAHKLDLFIDYNLRNYFFLGVGLSVVFFSSDGINYDRTTINAEIFKLGVSIPLYRNLYFNIEVGMGAGFSRYVANNSKFISLSGNGSTGFRVRIDETHNLLFLFSGRYVFNGKYETEITKIVSSDSIDSGIGFSVGYKFSF